MQKKKTLTRTLSQHQIQGNSLRGNLLLKECRALDRCTGEEDQEAALGTGQAGEGAGRWQLHKLFPSPASGARDSPAFLGRGLQEKSQEGKETPRGARSASRPTDPHPGRQWAVAKQSRGAQQKAGCDEPRKVGCRTKLPLSVQVAFLF